MTVPFRPDLYRQLALLSLRTALSRRRFVSRRPKVRGRQTELPSTVVLSVVTRDCRHAAVCELSDELQSEWRLEARCQERNDLLNTHVQLGTLL